MFSKNSSVVLIIDRLPASMLGPYGNTTIETTHFNDLASQSLLFDFALASDLDLETSCERFWFHSPAEPDDIPRSWIEDLSLAGTESVLITDDEVVASQGQEIFERVLYIKPLTVYQAAAEEASTQLAWFFAQVTAWLSSEFAEGQLVWVHSRGLAGAWDAPYEWRERLTGEEDPSPPDLIDVRDQLLDRELDPDELLGWQQAALAQVMLVDDCLGVFLDQLDQVSQDGETLLWVAASRGCGLGEHRQIGIGKQLYSEAIHVPLMARFPNQAEYRSRRTGRSGSLVDIRMLSEIVAAWQSEDEPQIESLLNGVDRILPDCESELISMTNDEFEMIQTHAWKLMRSASGKTELFAKPDDRWDINDVSDRCPGIVEKMKKLLAECIAMGDHGWVHCDVGVDQELARRVE